jgi:hypothetical protein
MAYSGFAGTETDFADRNYSTHKTILSGDIGTQNVAADNSYHVVTAIDKTGVLLDGFTVQDGYCSGGPGGGIYAASASMSIRNCVIAGNYAGYGGGIGNGDNDSWLPSSMQIANCVLANNTAGSGGAMHSNGYSLLAEIVNCTIAGNSAASNGGGIANGSPMIIENSIIWDNLVGANPSNVYNYNNAAPMISYSDIEGCGGSPPGGTWNTAFGNDVGKNIAENPDFVDNSSAAARAGADGKLGTADDGLQLNGESPNISPCIDEGNNVFIHEVNDIAGNKRIRNSAVDMGAYECPYWGVCGDVLILDAVYDYMNINDPVNYGWQNESFSCDPMTFSVSFLVEDSANCQGGSNGNIQTGTFDITIFLPEEKDVTLSVEGNTERQNQPFDFGLIYVDEAADPEVWISGTQEGGGCGTEENPNMKVHNASVCSTDPNCTGAVLTPQTGLTNSQITGHIPEAQISLDTGLHHIRFKVDTWDENYHIGEYFNFSVTVSEP